MIDFDRLAEKFAIGIAYRLPRLVAYWAFIRVCTGNSVGIPYPGNPGERKVLDVARDYFPGNEGKDKPAMGQTTEA